MMKRPVHKCLMVNFDLTIKAIVPLSLSLFSLKRIASILWFAHSLMFNVHLLCRFIRFVFCCSSRLKPTYRPTNRTKEVRMSDNPHVLRTYANIIAQALDQNFSCENKKSTKYTQKSRRKRQYTPMWGMMCASSLLYFGFTHLSNFFFFCTYVFD